MLRSRAARNCVAPGAGQVTAAPAVAAGTARLMLLLLPSRVKVHWGATRAVSCAPCSVSSCPPDQGMRAGLLLSSSGSAVMASWAQAAPLQLLSKPGREVSSVSPTAMAEEAGRALREAELSTTSSAARAAGRLQVTAVALRAVAGEVVRALLLLLLPPVLKTHTRSAAAGTAAATATVSTGRGAAASYRLEAWRLAG